MSETTTVSAPAQNAADDASINFDDKSLDEIRQFIASARNGQTAPAEEEETPQPGAAPAGEASAQEGEEQKQQAEETKTPAEGEESRSGNEEEAVLSAEQLKTLPFEEFEKKAKEYLDSVEIPPELQTIIERLETEAKNRPETPAADFLGEEDIEVAKKVIDSFKRVVTFRQDETGELVPDTEGLKQLFATDFQKELPYILRDLNTLPSAKYQNHTVFQEFIRDYAGLDEAGMMNLEYLIEHRGRLPIPNYIPEGISPKFSEAFWQSPDREQIEEAVREAMDVIKDPNAPEYDKQMAETRLAQIHQRLYQVQAGLDAIKQQSEAARQIQEKNKEVVEQTAAKNYVETAKSLLESFTTEISRYLTDVFDETGAPLAALGVARLAEAAVASDDFSKIARQKLADMGIKYDWNKASGVIERLWQTEQKIAKLTLENANPLAVKLAKDEKAGILREIKRYEKELAGQVTKVLLESSSNKLKKKAGAVSKPAVVKSKVKGASGVTEPPQRSLDDYSKEELRSLIGELKYSLRQQGIMVP